MHPSIRRLVLQASLLLATAGCSAGSPDQTDTSPAESALRAWGSLAATSDSEPRVVWDDESGVAREVAGSFPLRGKEASEAVTSFLLDHGAVFGIRPGDLRLTSVRESIVGWHVRFEQRAPGRKVYGVEVAVHVARTADGMRAFLVRSAVVPRLTPDAASGSDSEASARALALAAGFGLKKGVVEQLEQVVLQDGRAARQVDVRGESPPRLLRIVLGDDGSLADAQDLLKYADGTGWVFDPNPVASTGDFTLADQSNADSPALTAARTQVTLQGLDASGRLSGSYVNAFNSLNTRAVVPSLAFDYTRSNDFFEEVMAYYHIDRAERRLQSLGFTQVMNWPIDVQVNGKQQDNSWYDTKKNLIMFGSGGVDDAEDADVILHEYGHAVLWDQVPGFGAGFQAAAIDEGFADFHAVMAHSVGPAIKTDPACIAPWDATSYSPPPCLRRTDLTRHFPEHAQNDSHEDGQMWSSALYEASATLSPLEALRLAVESNFLLSPNTTFQQASDAVRQTDLALNAGANAELLRRLFTWRGMNRTITPAYAWSGGVGIAFRVRGLCASLFQPARQVGRRPSRRRDCHPRALRPVLRGAGATITSYLYDPDIHLYAIYTGALGAFTSVAVPGDTVRIRLVSDSQVTDSGYAIDSYEIPGNNVADAGAPDSEIPDAMTSDALSFDVIASDAPGDAVDESSAESGPDAAFDAPLADVNALDGPWVSEASLEDASPQDASPQDASPPDASPQDAASQDSASKDANAADAFASDAAGNGGSSPTADAGDGGLGHNDAAWEASADGSAMTDEREADSGGCGCRAAGAESTPPRTLAALTFAGLLGAFRRRRRSAERWPR